MSRFGPKGPELNPTNDNEFVISGLCGALAATPFAILFSEHDNNFAFEEQVVTFVVFMIGVLLRAAYTESRARNARTVAHA